MSLISLVEVSSKINEVDFERASLYKNLPDTPRHCIPQTFTPKKRERNALDVKYWREMKKIPGDKDWEGEFESYPDITLSAIGTVED